jgi:hypothetical protein
MFFFQQNEAWEEFGIENSKDQEVKTESDFTLTKDA